MKYQNKKAPEIFAAVDFEDEKTKTTRLIYLTGEKQGCSFVLSNSTLKRWWKHVPSTEEQDQEDMINTPYRPEVKPHRVPVPESVIEYENATKFNTDVSGDVATNTVERDLPTFEMLCDDLSKYIEKTYTDKHISLKGTKTTVWRKNKWISVYADETVRDILAYSRLPIVENKDKARPWGCRISTAEQYDSFIRAFTKNCK